MGIKDARSDPRWQWTSGHGQGNGEPEQGSQTKCRPGMRSSTTHKAVGGHSGLAYTEILADERKDTAAGF